MRKVRAKQLPAPARHRPRLRPGPPAARWRSNSVGQPLRKRPAGGERYHPAHRHAPAGAPERDVLGGTPQTNLTASQLIAQFSSIVQPAGRQCLFVEYTPTAARERASPTSTERGQLPCRTFSTISLRTVRAKPALGYQRQRRDNRPGHLRLLGAVLRRMSLSFGESSRRLSMKVSSPCTLSHA